jgi:NADH-quinone oxidoreductase subunit J
MEEGMILNVLFFYLAAVTIISALFVVIKRNAVHSAIALLVTFVHVAGIFLLLNSEFLAAVQILVYAGAILVLIIFVIMYLNVTQRYRMFNRLKLIAFFVGVVLFAEVLYIITRTALKGQKGEFPIAKVMEMGNTEAIGKVLFTDYLFPFEIASLILLVAMIGAIVLAKKEI